MSELISINFINVCDLNVGELRGGATLLSPVMAWLKKNFGDYVRV